MRRIALLCLLPLCATTLACRQSASAEQAAAHGGSPAGSVRADTTRPTVAEVLKAEGIVSVADSVRADSARRDSVARGLLVERHDTLAATAASPKPAAAADTAGRDSASAAAKTAAKPAPKKRPWPTGPEPLPGAVLPGKRVIAFYGNPITTKLGILGRVPPKQMLDSLEKIAQSWQRADTTRGVMPALHLIASVASAHPGKDGMYRNRMSDATIETVAKWAEERGWVMFVDLQVGQSDIAKELEWIKPWLARPYMHLALDPEFAMYRKPEGRRVPGKYIGIMDAADVNKASRVLAKMVDSLGLPPKMLVVHRFTDHMLTNASKIELDPRVQVVIDMDGFGPPSLKRGTWKRVILREPVQWTGWKLFFNPRNDKPMMKPSEVLELDPQPVYIQYQ